MGADLVMIEAVDVRVTETHVVVVLSDGREIATHWPLLDEDLGVDGMLRGSHDASR